MTRAWAWGLIGVGIVVWGGAEAPATPANPGADEERPRLLVLTDIGGDPDDIQSLRRLLVYANEFEIVGLIASASGTPGEVGRAVTRPELILEAIDDYASVVASLRRHAEGFPDPEALRAVVAGGNPERGVEHLGPGRSTAGSRHIVEAIEASDRPLHVAIWGGAHDLAQALSDLRDSFEAEDLEARLGRLRVYAIVDQDKWGSGVQGTGEWIREQFPDLRYVESGPPEMDRMTAAFRGMYQNDSRGGRSPGLPLVTDEVAALNQQDWVERNVLRDRGPLGERYPVVSQNPGSGRNTRGVKEGDTPSWFFVLPNGLGDPSRPEIGGWGGRFRHDQGGHFIDAEDDHPSGSDDPSLRQKWTVARWRAAYQNDFAARMLWCVSDPEEANHPPVALVDGEGGRQFVRRDAKPGDTIELDASGSTDPDGDAIGFRWWVYHEATGFDRPDEVGLDGDTSARVTVTVPEGSHGREIHVILEVEDEGTPALTSYRRVILRIADEAGK